MNVRAEIVTRLGWLVLALGACAAPACRCAKPSAATSTSAAVNSAPSASTSSAASAGPQVAGLEHVRSLLERPGGFASRAEAVALADELGVRGAKLPPEQRATVAMVVGDLRRRAYRTFHVQADAREAIEQYRQASRFGGETAGGCQAMLSAIVLESEVGGEPAKAYEAVYTHTRQDNSEMCAAAWQGVMDDLHAYRPDPTRLVDIDRKIAEDRSKQRGAEVAAAADGPVVVPGPESKPGPATISGIEAFGAKDAARVVIQLTGPAKYEVGYIGERDDGNRPRLFIDLLETKRGKAPRSKEVGGLVERYRLGNHGGKTRVVLDLERSAPRRVFYLPEPFRVIIDVGGPATRPSAVADPAGRRVVERVVLDPGHGGEDPGAIGPGGLKEKDVVLDIAHRAAPVLSRELGVATMLTRDTDRFVPLEERTARANAFHADLFVSIHCNATESPEGRGIQSYVLDMTRDDISMRVAARENATSAAAGVQLGQVLANLRVEELSGRSHRFASLLQQATMGSMKERFGDTVDGGVRSAAFFVLLGAQMPATLFEASFISNPAEESRLATADYRQKLADGIANAVRAYRDGR